MYKIKAVSLRQPWAWLVVKGIKHYETRTWKVHHRGVLAIHAAHVFGAMERDVIIANKLMSQAMINAGATRENVMEHLALGAMVGLVMLEDVVAADRVHPEALEDALGDFHRGRYAWRLERAVIFERPVPVQGLLGLFDWTIPDAVIGMVRKAREEMER